MDGFLLDLRYALRSLRRSPGYLALCVGALALGIGANGAIFSLVHALMLRPLPYPDPERLVLPHLALEGLPESSGPPTLPWSYPKLQTLVAEQRVFTEVAGFTAESANLTGAGEPERLELEMASPAYLSILGVRPIRGRGLVEADERPDAPLVAVVGEGLWRRRFGARPEFVGRTLRLGNSPVTVVGILPAGFAGLTGQAELWVPLAAARVLYYPEALSEVGNHYLEVVARLRPGVDSAALAAEMERLGRVVAETNPMPGGGEPTEAWSAGSTSLAETRRDPFVRRSLQVLMGAVALVLLIACANLASLALLRAARRRRELAVRAAIGAGRGRLVRQTLLESLVLAALGCGLGLLVAAWLVRALSAMRPEALGTWGIASTDLFDLATVGIDRPVVLFCAGAALLTALLFGLAPALRAARVRPGPDLRAGGAALAGRGGRGGAGGGRPLLVAGQTALALVTLVGAGLLLRSLWALQSVPLGVEPERVLTFAVRPSDGSYTRADVPGFHGGLVERIAALPGVRSVAVGSCVPASGASGCNSTIVLSRDAQELSEAERFAIGWHMVGEDYFRTLGVPVLAGRAFDRRDRPEAPPVVILNETAARRLWPDGRAVGRRMQMGTMGLNGETHAEVIGVVGDVRYRRLEDPASPEVYMADSQLGLIATTLFVRTSGDPLELVPAVRGAVQSVNRDLPIYRVRTLEEQLGFALSRARFGSVLLLAFAAVAVALAALGVYGVLAQSVAARRREIGLRMALGAAAGEVERLVLRQGMAVALAGALAGIALALALSGLLRNLLFEVAPRDPVTFAAVPLALLSVAALACMVPARRAARVDPTVVLRQE